MGPRNASRAGYTILELTIAASLFVVVMLSSIALMERDSQLSRSTLAITAVEQQSTQMLYRLERELADALIDTPRAILTDPLNAGETDRLRVAGVLGFPQAGQVLLWGGGNEELVAYEGVQVTGHVDTVFSRGQMIIDDETYLGRKSDGQYLRRGLSSYLI